MGYFCFCRALVIPFCFTINSFYSCSINSGLVNVFSLFHKSIDLIFIQLQAPHHANLWNKAILYSICTASQTDHWYVRYFHLLHSSLVIKSLHNHIHTAQIRSYIVHRYKIRQYQEPIITWKTCTRVHKSMTTITCTNRWACKWFSGFCRVGIMLETCNTKYPWYNTNN